LATAACSSFKTFLGTFVSGCFCSCVRVLLVYKGPEKIQPLYCVLTFFLHIAEFLE
jgi:hypothetical protein